MPTALFSVYNKEGVVDFARGLADQGYNDFLASSGTAKVLRDAGLPARDVAEIVGGDPILDHRVVTLSREIAAGLLAQDTPEDRAELERLGIPWIDLVCVDFYPLREEVVREGATEQSVLKQTDIGGPTLLSEAAKGRRIVVSSVEDRAAVLHWLQIGKPKEEEVIRLLAAKADFTVSSYRALTASYHSDGLYDSIFGERVQECKYGENAAQSPAALFTTHSDDPLALDKFKLVAGEAPSYNNLVDVDRMLQTMTHIAAAFDERLGIVPNIAVGVKHGNPCGAAVSPSPHEALQDMLTGDIRAIFGGLVMTNIPIDEGFAEILLTYASQGRRLLDGIVAPSFTEGAIEMLRRKGDKCRFLSNPALSILGRGSLDSSPLRRHVRGGYLLQPNYSFVMNFASPEMDKPHVVEGGQVEDLLLAWAVGSTSNSNTVTLVKGRQLIGNGVGQQDRVSCCELAIKRAQDAEHEIEGAVAYSDSFFPFPDGPEVLAKAGVKAILTSSGSVKDKEVQKVCAEYGVRLYMIPDHLGRGFYNH